MNTYSVANTNLASQYQLTSNTPYKNNLWDNLKNTPIIGTIIRIVGGALVLIALTIGEIIGQPWRF